jgi:hypothetical protein
MSFLVTLSTSSLPSGSTRLKLGVPISIVAHHSTEQNPKIKVVEILAKNLTVDRS